MSILKDMRANDSVVQELYNTTSENTKDLKHLNETCAYNREQLEKVLEEMRQDVARTNNRYDETMRAADIYFDEFSDITENIHQHLTDLDNEIAEARKMQTRTHITCGIAMVSSIASIILTVILA